MIVNTAYIYMGGGAAVNPNLWQDGVANYPVEFTDSSLSADGLLLKPRPTTDPAATFSELQLTNFTNFELSGNNLTFVDIGIKIEFFDSSNQLLGTGNATFSRGTITKTVALPIPARIKNAKIKITNISNSSITIISAVLT